MSQAPQETRASSSLSEQTVAVERQEGERRRRQIMNLALLIMAVALVVAIVLLLFAWQLKMWQLLVSSVWAAAAVALFGRARRLARRGRVEAASNLVMATVALVFPLLMAFWEGAGWILAGSAAAVSGLFAGLVWPRRRAAWGWVMGVGSAGAVLLLDWLMGRFRPWARFDLARTSFLSAFVYGVFALVILALLWELARAYRAIRTIRARLIATFVVIVLLVAAAVSAGSALVGVQSARQRAMDQLESVAALKRRELSTWVKDLKLDLAALITESYEIERARSLLSGAYTYEFRRDAESTLRLRFERVIERTGRFQEIFLVDLQGQVVMSTDVKQQGKNDQYEAYFEGGLQGSYLHPPIYYPAWNDTVIVVAQPLYDLFGNMFGLLAGRVGLDKLNEIAAERTGLGETGETYLVSADHTLLTPTRRPFQVGYFVRSEGVDAVFGLKQDRQGTYDVQGMPVYGYYAWVPELGMVLAAEQEATEVTRGAQATFLIDGGIAVGAALLAVLASLVFARSISVPLSNLSGTAARIAGGEVELEARVEREDEIGALARAFNSMTAQLRDLIGSLEGRVAERTRGLETAAEVSRATASVLDIDRLLPQVVELVRERFGLYYVGLFLLDEEEKFAVLRAGTGEAGQQMLAQGWRLEVGGNSMIGRCVASGQAGIEQDVEGTEDEAHPVARFRNPLLPETRSELALPLRFGGRIVGAMTVQSARPAFFDEANISVLQTVADQVAVAIQNARLFAEAQAALEQAQAVQQRYLGQAWEAYLSARTVSGYEWAGAQVTPLGDELLEEVRQVLSDGPVPRAGVPGPSATLETAGRTLSAHDGSQSETASPGGTAARIQSTRLLLPLVQGGQVVGALGFEKGEGGQGWDDDQVALVQALADQLIQAAENQRLIDETQGRAAREQLARQITDRMRRAVSWDELMQVALREMASVLGSPEAFVQWTSASQSTREG